MSAPVISRYEPRRTAIGDGTTGKSRFVARVRRWRMLGIVIITVLATGLLLTIIRPGGSKIPLHPDNPEPNGAMALTQILGEHDVQVRATGSISDAVKHADADTTVFVLDSYLVSADSYAQIHARGANLVVARPEFSTLLELDMGLRTASLGAGADPFELADANCAAPAAQRAREIPVGRSGFHLDEHSTSHLCFTQDEVGPYAASADGRVHVFANIEPFLNENLADAGNAALTIGALGEKENLVWVIPSLMQNDMNEVDAQTSLLDFLPPWAEPAFLLVLFLAAFTALWRGRRLGPLVSEPLPVEVRAAETTHGLGRMYRRSNEVAHAATSLRAGTALRCAERLGVAPTASSEALVSAVAHAVKRPYEEIAGLLLGATVQNETDLIALAQMLDHLESEVHAS